MTPNQLSNTAAFIAIKFYGLTREAPLRALFDEDIIQFYDRLVRHLPAPLRYYHRGLKKKALRRFFTFWEELLLPGDLMHIILRKWYLTRWVEDLRQQGYRQMLVLGAGFDHLATLNVSEGIKCTELDTPKMIRLKQDFIKRNRYTHQNLTLKEAFFSRDSLGEVLESKTNLEPAVKTIIVAEGFFDYFAQQQCSVMLKDLNQFFDNDVALLSTLFSLDELSGFHSFVYRNSIRLAGEELKLGFDLKGFVRFLQKHNFQISKNLTPADMQQDVLIPQNITYPVLKGFYLLKSKREKII